MWKDSETELDFLDYDYLINVLKDTITNDKLLPASIGVYGDWGSGKSSLMYMCKKRLEQEDKKIKCLMFNGWLFESYEDAKSAILGSILDEISKQKQLTKKAKSILKGLYESIDKFKLVRNGIKIGADLFLTGGLGTIADITINSVLNQVSDNIDSVDVTEIKEAIKDELNNKELREDIRKFQQEFENLLVATKISRLVVFIDELDRCSTDTILDTLEAIKLFMFNGKVAFVIGADERHISYAVNSKYKEIEGSQISIGKEYLEKLIQYPIRIPKLNEDEVEIYISCLLFQAELPQETFDDIIERINTDRLDDFIQFSLKKVIDEVIVDSSLKNKAIECMVIAKQLGSVLSRGLNGNPRQCKRFLNSLDMRIKMATYKNKILDRKILAKVMMLEYIKPNLFKKMAELSGNGMLPRELLVFEEDTDEEADMLKIWKDDMWFQNWCKIDPKLANEDLTLYFYFTRTSLDEKVNYISSKLSPSAQEIVDKLVSKSDLQLKDAINKANNVSDSEAAKILEIVFDSMISDSSIDKDKFNAFISWGETRESIYSETVSNIKSLNGNQISMGLAPIIVRFAKKINKIVEVKEITDTWILENSRLKAVFKDLE
ncbi:KAP family P-loop NTPase fold protein [Tissierella praeacuta]|uniref:KAP family P-loop NTPase fold protein n=1 Tax=Tissierella praeacuta TaxID=43131 RepID=UPI003DA426B6